jgi:hypothetical protein
LLLLIPALLAAVAWFITAPVPRYGLSFFWIAAATIGAVALSELHGLSSRTAYRLAILACICAPLAVVIHKSMLARHYLQVMGTPHTPSIHPALQPLWIPAGPDDGFHPFPKAELLPRTTRWGLTVYLPKHPPETWAAPLLATHSFDRNLRLRRPGDLGSGFVSDPAKAPGE